MKQEDPAQTSTAVEERLIVGLGNPEEDYADTRHNLGFACARELARRLGVRIDRKRWQSLVGRSETEHLWLVLPQTYMKLSGQAGAEAARDIPLPPHNPSAPHPPPPPPLLTNALHPVL